MTSTNSIFYLPSCDVASNLKQLGVILGCVKIIDVSQSSISLLQKRKGKE